MCVCVCDQHAWNNDLVCEKVSSNLVSYFFSYSQPVPVVSETSRQELRVQASALPERPSPSSKERQVLEAPGCGEEGVWEE